MLNGYLKGSKQQINEKLFESMDQIVKEKKSLSVKKYILTFIDFVKTLSNLSPSTTFVENNKIKESIDKLNQYLKETHAFLLNQNDLIDEVKKKYHLIKANFADICKQITPNNKEVQVFENFQENKVLAQKIEYLKTKVSELAEFKEKFNFKANHQGWVDLYHMLIGLKKDIKAEYVEEATKFSEDTARKNELSNSIQLDKKSLSEIKSKLENNRYLIKIHENLEEEHRGQLEYLEEERKLYEENIKIIELEKFRQVKDIEDQKEAYLKQNQKQKEKQNKVLDKLFGQIEDQNYKIFENLKIEMNVEKSKTNFILIIDRSGSMSSSLKEINKKSFDFFDKLKKLQNPHFYGTVIYFNEEAEIFIDTKPLEDEKFKELKRVKAIGDTSYVKPFEKLLNIVEKNIMSDIKIFNIIFFTDGEDHGNFEDVKNILKKIKFSSNRNISLFVRGFGDSFSQIAFAKLKEISTYFSPNLDYTEIYKNIKFFEISNDINAILNFFTELSENFFSYFDETRKKICGLNNFGEFLENQKKRLSDSSKLDLELERLNSLKAKILKTEEGKISILKKLNNNLDQIKKKITEHYQMKEEENKEIQLLKNEQENLENSIKETKSRLELFEKEEQEFLKEEKTNLLALKKKEESSKEQINQRTETVAKEMGFPNKKSISSFSIPLKKLMNST